MTLYQAKIHLGVKEMLIIRICGEIEGIYIYKVYDVFKVWVGNFCVSVCRCVCSCVMQV